MTKVYKAGLLLAFVLQVSTGLFGQNNFFSDMGSNRTVAVNAKSRVTTPENFRTLSLNNQSMRSFLWTLPSEESVLVNRGQSPIIELPMPDGRMAKFRVWESSIQEPGLEEKFPTIKTFAGQGIDDPYATVRFDYGPNGFHAQVLTITESYYIDPYAQGDTQHCISYYRKDLKKGERSCKVDERNRSNRLHQTARTSVACQGTTLRKYRVAIACTGEYAQAPGINAGTNTTILHNAIVTSLNRVNGIFEKELSIRLVLVANNNLIEFRNASTDPFTANDDPLLIWQESQTVITSKIGAANFDIGHTFSTGGGGFAALGGVCVDELKAMAATGTDSPTGDSYDIDFVAHEIGHQFGAEHIFNAGTGTCGDGNGVAASAYEPGGGTTIMSYAGLCDINNLQPNVDAYFHGHSIDQIIDYVTNGDGAGCAVKTFTGNTLPVIAALPNNGVTIPVSTPFKLSGSATDANGDALTYCWEQFDLGDEGDWNSGASADEGNSVPLFRSRAPKTTGERTFPDMAVILAGFPDDPPAETNGLKGETLSPVPRDMNFRLTVRDNRPGGGGTVSSGSDGCQNSAAYTIHVAGDRPFAVTTPNGGESYPTGSVQTIKWDNAGTNAAPFNVANVKISLSTDGGLTYPVVLAASTPNDGTESLTLPAVSPTTTARIKIEAIGNIFFAISNSDFAITESCQNPGGLTVSNINTTSATVNWTAVSGAVSYRVDYKLNSATTWTTAAATTTALSVNLTGLTNNTAYNWRVRTNCASNNSTFSTSNFTTGASGTCTPPSGLTTSAITDNSATVSWSAVSGAASYVVDYRVAGTTTWTSAATATTALTLNITGLTSSTNYQWRVRTKCSGTNSTFTQSQFTTLAPCIAPGGLTVAAQAARSVTLSWTPVAGALSYTVEYKSAGVNVTTWITAASSTALTTLTISGLTPSSIYNWRVKTNCAGLGSAYTQANFSTLSPCQTPVNLATSNVRNTSAKLSWDPVEEVSSYTVEYKRAALSTWTVAATGLTTNSYQLTGLFENTTYDWRVKSICFPNASTAYATKTFLTTNVCGESYDINTLSGFAYPIPLNYVVTGRITPAGDVDFYQFTAPVSGVLNVTLTNLPTNYNLELLKYNSYNSLTTVGKSERTGTSNEIVTTYATANTKYAVKVTGTVGGVSFSHATACYSLKANLAGAKLNPSKDDDTRVTIAPNPASDNINVIITGNDELKNVMIFDVNGRLMMKRQVSQTVNSLDIHSFSGGVYFLRITNSAGEELYQQKFIKN